MKQQILSLLASVAFVFASTPGFAQTVTYTPAKKTTDSSTSSGGMASISGSTAPAPTPTVTVGGVGPASYTPTIISAPDASRTTGMQNNGQNASAQQGNGGAAAAAALAAMMATAAAACPACALKGTCGLCAAALAGAAASGLTGSNMDAAQNLSNQQVTDVNPNANPATKPAFSNSPQYTAAMADSAKVNASGSGSIAKDFKSFTTPDGRSISTASLANPASSGLTGPELAALKDLQKQAQTAAAAAAARVGLDSETGGETYSHGGNNNTSSTTTPGFQVAAAKARTPANVAGAYRDLNGDRIGVSVDSMFEMMHRRYRASSDQNYFIPPAK